MQHVKKINMQHITFYCSLVFLVVSVCCDTARPKRELAVNVKTLGSALKLFALISCHFLFLDALHKICLVCIAEMVQEPIRKNAAHFMTLMPMFAQRLAQRDYDFILVPPNKKRLLLKMYTVGEQEKLRLVWDE